MHKFDLDTIVNLSSSSESQSPLDNEVQNSFHFTLLITFKNTSKLYNICLKDINESVIVGRGRNWTEAQAGSQLEFVQSVKIPDPQISSKHCSFQLKQSSKSNFSVMLKDLKSLNGTELNGIFLNPTESGETIIVNDEIMIGATQIKVMTCVCSSCDLVSNNIQHSSSTVNGKCEICGTDLALLGRNHRDDHVRTCNGICKERQEEVSCMICGMELNSFSLEEREIHVNNCCDSSKLALEHASPNVVARKVKKRKEKDRFLGTNEEIEKRIARIDKDIESLRKQRESLVNHLTKRKTISSNGSSIQDIADALFDISQSQGKVEGRSPSSYDQEVAVAKMNATAENRTPLWDVTKTSNIQHECIKNKDKIMRKNKAEITDEMMVNALTRSIKTEDLYCRILLGNTVNVVDIQNAMNEQLGSKIPLKQLKSFLDKQGITYKQHHPSK